uniref:Fe2OG dioxygenase domain-containing protein n=1 Tax=Globisporangium ultimum (strain ATCC 200006 / CBS 805.95 / DAOM BR144) TaxID=431595 RepID=K3WQW1_GLOUD
MAATKAASAAPAPKQKAATSSFPFSSVLVALVAVAVAAFAVLKPAEFQTAVESAKTRVLLALDQYKDINNAPQGFDCTGAHQYLTDATPVKGFHVLCAAKTAEDKLHVMAFKDGNFANKTVEAPIDFAAFKTSLEQVLEIPPPKDEIAKKYKQPYAFFTPDGKRLEVLSDMVNNIVYLFEGGQFIWPGIKIGHKTVVKDVYGKGDVVMETLSMIPLVFGVDEFLKDEEIDVILDLSMEHLAPSGVSLIDGHENRPATDWRTSTTYFLSSSKHQLVRDIDRRTADITKVPISHQEDVQVLRYEKTQKYDHHMDYFGVDQYQNSPDILEMINHGYKNRMITVFWYMSDVAKGGHTIFPRAGGAPQPTVMNDCSKGLKVPPRKRKVIIFYSMLPTGEGDPMSLHGGCPVEEGTKYSGNKWVWNKPN